jgi:hypothetical protein
MYNTYMNTEFELLPEFESLLLGEDEYGNINELYEVPGALSFPAPVPGLKGLDLTKAVHENRAFAESLHWGCIVAGNVRAGEEVLKKLRLWSRFGKLPNEQTFAKALSVWQKKKLVRQDGILNGPTWTMLLADIPAAKFKPLLLPVFYKGVKLGFLEKTMPYQRCFYDSLTAKDCHAASTGRAGEYGGAEIEFGFRITNMDAVKKAGFADDKGPQFRWIQTVEFITVPAATPSGFKRSHSQVIDPTVLAGAIPDKHPYYWDEETPPHSSSYFLNSNFTNQVAKNQLCYDLIFKDYPKAPLIAAKPGQRAYFNFEVALVGKKPGSITRNVILNSIKWGYDIFITGGKPNVDLNRFGPGPLGGSATFRKILSKQITDFPKHCFEGDGYSAAATCK